MRTGIEIDVTLQDRKALEALIANWNTPAKIVWRAEIILATSDDSGTNEIMRRTGKSKTCVRRWQERFMQVGVAGLKRDKTRPPGGKPLTPEIKAKVLAKTTTETPPNATRRSARTMAKAMGLSHTSVQRIWDEAGLKPHLVRRFKVSNDPHFEEKGDECGRPLHEPAGPGSGAVCGREEPDPGARPHAAGPAAEARARRR